MIDGRARPRLARKARLRFDRHAGRYLLLYPDKGMLLNASAAAIVQLCTGDHTLDEIVQRLSDAAAGAERAHVERDVQSLLAALIERALVQLEGPVR